MYELTICSRDGQSLRTFDLARVEAAHKRLVVGRADDCDIRIGHGQVSRHHCAIEPDAEDDREWTVRDMGSTHGLIVDGRRVAEVAVRDGLVVEIGPALLKFGQVSAAITGDIQARVRAELGDE